MQARTRMDRLLGARMDGSVALVTSLGRARLGLGLGLELGLGLGLRVGRDALILNDVMPIPRLPVTCRSYPFGHKPLPKVHLFFNTAPYLLLWSSNTACQHIQVHVRVQMWFMKINNLPLFFDDQVLSLPVPSTNTAFTFGTHSSHSVLVYRDR